MGNTKSVSQKKSPKKSLSETGRKKYRPKNSRRPDQLIGGPSINKENICISKLPAKTGLKNILLPSKKRKLKLSWLITRRKKFEAKLEPRKVL